MNENKKTGSEVVKELISKYKTALKVAESDEKLKCFIIQISSTIDKLSTYSYIPTSSEVVWVDYFLEKNAFIDKNIKPAEAILDRYTAIINFTYLEYYERKDSIEQGFITGENLNWLIDRLYLNRATDEQLNEYWFAIDRFFRNLMMIKDEAGEWKWNTESDISWYRDCDSAWKETVNYVARSRREGK